MNEIVKSEERISELKGVAPQSTGLIDVLTSSLSIPRDILPDNEQITFALQGLPRELNMIPMKYRNEFIAKAVIAVSVGLFDGAIVYVWNCVIKELRTKIQEFGLQMIKNILSSERKEKSLDDINDATLLELAYQLNIITEQGHMFLNQCRETRNQASVAHPSRMKLNDRELIVFINRCCEYGLSDATEVAGIDLKTFVSVLEKQTTTDENLKNLSEQIGKTFELQKKFFIELLYSKYIDPTESSHVRNNALKLAKMTKNEFSDPIKAVLLTRHNEIMVKGDSEKKSAANSRKFFFELEMTNILNDSEKVAIFNKAIENLKNAHNGYNNFYTEVPFAERLEEVSNRITPVPEVVISLYVDTIWNCYLGNTWGVSSGAYPNYKFMLENLTPKGIEVLLDELSSDLTKSENTIDWKHTNIQDIVSYYDKSTMLNTNQVSKLNQIKAIVKLN